MRHPRALRLLNVLACAPVVALLATTTALTAHAQAIAGRPAPYVVAVDAGHGGTADNANPDQPFDPGVIGPAGTLEKDLTLDVAKRVQRLLTADRVRVVMTRVDDRFVDIGPRMDAANAAAASLFVSIHFNSYADPTMGGALVLYPNDASLPFAQTMSDTLGRLLPAAGIAANGTQLKPDLWIHAAMPAVTVEGGYLSNPREEQLLNGETTREALAVAIVAGVEKQAPDITIQRATIVGWEQAHGIRPPGISPPSGHRPAHAGGGQVPARPAAATEIDHGVRNGLMVLLGMGVVWQRRRLGRGLMAGLGVLIGRLRGGVEQSAVGGHRRRLKQHRRQVVLQRSRRVAMNRRSVYEEFSL
ncbi:MAG: N-acetylmuramoyl-L-alanine amidase [Candidatus Dormibacteria bacterium]